MNTNLLFIPCIFTWKPSRESHRFNNAYATRSYRSRKATASPFPESAMYWCNSNGSAVLETRVSSYLSVAGEAAPRGDIRILKGWYRRTGPGRVGIEPTTAVEEGGAGVCRMPKLPLKHDARTPSQTARLQLTLSPSPFPSLHLPPRSASSKSPYRASDSETRSIILDMAFPLSPSSPLRAHVPPRNHPPVTPSTCRPICGGSYVVSPLCSPSPPSHDPPGLNRGKMLSSRVSQLFRTYFLPFFRSVCFCLYKVTLIENLISRIAPLLSQANDIFKKFPAFSRSSIIREQ